MEVAVKKRFLNNFISLVVLQGASYVFPLITVPYLVRVLGAGNYGLLAFAAAFNQFFVVFTDYGFNLTATRSIAIHRTNFKKVSEIYCTVMLIKAMLMVGSFLLLIAIVLAVPGLRKDLMLYVITFLTVVGSVLFPVWLFQGLEQMRYITAINVSAKLIATLGIFIMVRHETDYLLAAMLQSMGFVIAGIASTWIAVRYFNITLVIPRAKQIKEQLNEGKHVFVSSFLANILASSGVFVLGLFQSKEITGVYAAVEKLSKAVVGLFYPITQAMFPYISSRFAVSYQVGRDAVLRLAKYLVPVTFAVALIVFMLAKPLVLMIYGEKLAGYSHIIRWLAPWLFLGVVNNLLGYQYLIGSGKSRQYSLAFLGSALVILVVFVATVPFISYYGVLVGMNLGELVLTCGMIFFIVSDYKQKKINSSFRVLPDCKRGI